MLVTNCWDGTDKNQFKEEKPYFSTYILQSVMVLRYVSSHMNGCSCYVCSWKTKRKGLVFSYFYCPFLKIYFNYVYVSISVL